MLKPAFPKPGFTMSNFPIVATILSMILGLSVTRLLLGVLTVFRIRRVAKPDWVPLAWAGILFTTQLDFWWAVNGLPAIKVTFTFLEFLLLVLLACRFLYLRRCCSPVVVRMSRMVFRSTSSRMAVMRCCSFPLICSSG